MFEFGKAGGVKRSYTFDKKHFRDAEEVEIISS